MALQLVGAIADGQIALYLDVVANRVVGVTVENTSTTLTGRITVTRASSSQVVAEETVGPGATATRTIPNNRRFDYDAVLADWGYSLELTG